MTTRQREMDTTTTTDPLQGACSCGRNHYLIAIPRDPLLGLQVLYDDVAEHASNLTLRIPLTHLHSTTYAFFPDETHAAIRRSFTPPHASHTKRHFCGFCGTPLSYWSEETADEAEHVRVNLGSLLKGSLERLQDLGVLGADEEEEGHGAEGQEAGNGPLRESGGKEVAKKRGVEEREFTGNPWFEEMIEGSELGRIKRRRGGKTSTDGRRRYEWEIVEVGGEDREEESGSGGVGNTGKRKLDEVGDGDGKEDTVMH